MSEEPTPAPDDELHEPCDKAIAVLGLELERPLLAGDDKSSRAWQEIRSAQRSIGQTVQRAIGEVVLHVRTMRAAGKTRFATPAERASEELEIPLPVECYTKQDLSTLNDAILTSLKASGTSEYVYSSVAHKLMLGEFSKSKLKALLRGEIAYPVVRNIGIIMRGRNWRLVTTERVANGKIYLDVDVEIAALKPGLGKMTLHCYALHGRHLDKVLPILEALQEMGLQTTGSADGPAKNWTKGALTLRPVRRPGQPEKWQLLLPYSAPRAASGGDAVVAVHRSVVNMLSASVQTERGVRVYHYPGHAVVALKNQLYARRKVVSADLAAQPHRGRGVRHHYKALARLADAEKRATQTELWRAARWAQGIAETCGANLVYVDDFTSFDPDRSGPPWEPYVRNFPWSDLKMKIVDALTRRAGITVQEKKSRYITQRCPECGHVDADNVAKLPVARGTHLEKGVFKCLSCKFKADPDVVAARNLLTEWDIQPANIAM
jgi:hypothetical protein